MKLFIGRHAYAGPASADPKRERERPLVADGVKTARAIAQAMIDADEIPNVIFSSPYTRAVQTADIYGKAFGVNVNVVGDMAPQRPLTPALVNLISQTGAEKLKRLMLVGHVDNTTPTMNDIDGKGWDDLVMGEVRRLRIDRDSLEWEIRWQVRPSDLGLKDIVS